MKLKIEQIYCDFHQQLKLFIRKRVNNESDADDILQDVFVKIHHSIDNLRQEEKLTSWLYQITRNVIVDFYRKRASLPQTADDSFFDDLPDNPKEGSKPIDDLTKCLEPMLKRLPLKYKEAIEFTEYQDHSQKELAEKLGISVPGAKSRVQRARSLLQNLIQECCHLEFNTLGNITNHYPKQKDCKYCKN